MSKGRVLVAMSGGVDSSVVAWLLQQQGYECVGATMRLATNEDDRPGERTCCSVDDVADAREVCWRLGIRHYVFDYTRLFERDVIEPFVATYEAGGTPNPCVACNRRLKFGALLDRALELGCDYLATGHYASVAHAGTEQTDGGRHVGDAAGGAAGGHRGTYQLLRGIDAAKDQSYFLFGLTQARLAHVLFPLGGLHKATQVRTLAEQAGLAIARKRDSEGICFVPGGDHLRFIEDRTGRAAGDGNILDTRGTVIGHHHGALRYTVGQRRGLGVAAEQPLYVCATDTRANTVTLGTTAELMSSSLVACDWNWVSGESLTAETGLRAAAKVRYHQPDQPCLVTPLADGRVLVEFDEAQRAVACGQAVVLYDGDAVLGGGIIERVA